MRPSLPFAFLLLAKAASAQTEFSVFTLAGGGAATTFATDYQCMGINPSNLGWSGKFEGKKISFGLLEFGYSLYTDALTKSELKEDFIKGFDDEFTYAEKQDVAKKFTDADFTINGDMTEVGFAITTPKAGGFAFHVADRYQWWSHYNKATAEILYLGATAPYFQWLLLSDSSVIANDPNLPESVIDQVITGFNDPGEAKKISTLMNGSAITQSWIREYALNWGYMMGTTGTVEWFGGVGFRYLTGFAYDHIRSEGGHLTAISSLSPGFEIDYGEAGKKNPSTVSGSSFSPVGTGFAGDVGFSVLIAKKAKVGVSYTNIGSITWDGNVYTATDDSLYALDSHGFNSYDIFNEAEFIQSENGVFNWTGETEVKEKTPSQVRTGASIFIKSVAEVGFDVIIPTNDVGGNYEKTVFAVGGNVTPLPWLTLSTGVTSGGNYDTRMPMGVVFRVPTGAWEAGVATRDFLSLVGDDTPTMSLVTGLLRFRI